MTSLNPRLTRDWRDCCYEMIMMLLMMAMTRMAFTATLMFFFLIFLECQTMATLLAVPVITILSSSHYDCVCISVGYFVIIYFMLLFLQVINRNTIKNLLPGTFYKVRVIYIYFFFFASERKTYIVTISYQYGDLWEYKTNVLISIYRINIANGLNLGVSVVRIV